MRLFSWTRLFIYVISQVMTCSPRAQAVIFEPVQSVDDVSGLEAVHYDYVENGALCGGRIAWTRAPTGRGDPLDDAQVTARRTLGAMDRETWNVDTLIDNGPPENRLDVVFLGDGYTEDDLELYGQQVDALVSGMFAEEPFASYAAFFNVHRVDVVSEESGVDIPPQDVYRDTALNMSYGCAGVLRFLCVDIPRAKDAAALAPAVDQIIVLANDDLYGGAGYRVSNLMTVAGGYPFVNLMLHEFGHSFGDLTDEYYYPGGQYNGPERPEANATIYGHDQLLQSGNKWAAWLDEPDVGTFEGCRYVEFGLFRPTDNSKMRSQAQPYGPVNTEALIKQLYQVVVPADVPTMQPQIVTCADATEKPLTVHVVPIEPESAEVSWSVDDRRLPGMTGTQLWLNDLHLDDRPHIVQARVTDRTQRVRDKLFRHEHMSITIEWQVEMCPQLECAGGTDCDGLG